MPEISFGAKAGGLGSEMELPLLPAVLNWQTFPRRSAGKMHSRALSVSQIVQRGSDDARGFGAIRNPGEAIRRWEA